MDTTCAPGAAMPWDVSASGAIRLGFGARDLAATLEDADVQTPTPTRIAVAAKAGLAHGLSHCMLAGIGGVAVPVKDSGGSLIASLSAVWVIGQQHRPHDLEAAVRATAREL
ncbi:MAG: hypothetical protein AAF674_15035 [Pseudomonadota bacterium]